MSEDGKFEIPGIHKSTEDFVHERGSTILDQMDVSSPAPVEVILKKVKTIKASEISGTRDNLTNYYPDIDNYFSETFAWAVEKVASGKQEITGLDLAKAYRVAVKNVRRNTTKQFSHIMFDPQAYGNMVDHFDMPIRKDIVERLGEEHNPLAEEYKKRISRWRE